MKPFLPMIVGALLVVLAGCDCGTPGPPAGEDSRPQGKTADTSRGGSKIVGTWRFVRSSSNRDPDWGTKLEFTPDGKVAMHGPGYANAGTYSLDKNTLTFNTAEKRTYTVAKLTDKELVLEIQEGFSRERVTFDYRRE
jgi:uncharacterized protein (TIGR03066 family)